MSKQQPEPIKNTPIPCKIIFLGESGVGKTSIINYYMTKNKGDPENTVAATSFNKNVIIDGLEINLELWDTAGQEKFRSITSLFYKDAMVCILVYDITIKESFDQLKTYWYNSVKEKGMKDALLAIVGNKSDLVEQEEVNQKDAQSFSESIDAVFKVVSAKEGIGIENLFDKILEKFKESKFMEELAYKYLSEKQRKTLNNNIKLKLEKDGNDNGKKKKKKCC